jgi:hypothetical protein
MRSLGKILVSFYGFLRWWTHVAAPDPVPELVDIHSGIFSKGCPHKLPKWSSDLYTFFRRIVKGTMTTTHSYTGDQVSLSESL